LLLYFSGRLFHANPSLHQLDGHPQWANGFSAVGAPSTYRSAAILLTIYTHMLRLPKAMAVLRPQLALRGGVQTRTKLTLAEERGVRTVQDEHIYQGVDQTAIKESQAPNRKETWAPSQRPRADAMTGPLFDGVDLSTQPLPYAAIDLIAQTPVRYVHHAAVCDGNVGGRHGGVQGHPKVFINVDKPGIHACTYCGTRYADEHHKKDIEEGKITKLFS